MPFMPRPGRSRVLPPLELRPDVADKEEDERFHRWLAASDDIMREHKDSTGWEEPPRGVLRRLSRRRH